MLKSIGKSVIERSLSMFPCAILFCLFFMGFSHSVTAQTPFENMDNNHDGRLSRSEFRGPPRAFMGLDGNKDGYISRHEASGTRLSGDVHGPKQFEKRPPSVIPAELIYVDTHNHLVGPRKMGEIHLEKSARIALKAMDATGVKMNLLLPMPQTANQKFRLYFEDLSPIVRKYPRRFAALGGGGSLNVMIRKAVQQGQVTNEMGNEFDARASELVRNGAVGFGEMTAEHFSMTGNHPYETAPPDHPLFLRLADLAARYDLPIDIHMEAIPKEMPMPSRFKSPPNPRMLKPNIQAFSRLLAHNRNAKIIWVHLGWDNTGKRTIALTRRLLAENSNLYMSIRIASGMKKRNVVNPTFPLAEDGRLKPEWLALFQEFPDRFIMGSDEIIKPADNHPSAGSIRSTMGMLDQLPPKLKARIGYGNAYRLYKLEK
ncbi:MAG: amidohydrolase family protein [Deltaproteobacteria bacterium]|nr:amidohydrolase family protein [Deltaproteobacteria bacterium]